MTGDVFTARFANCQFDETVFPSLWGDIKVPIELLFQKKGEKYREIISLCLIWTHIR
ncbi:hypothetical protein LguiA_026374 [Lonicera macranthoides]